MIRAIRSLLTRKTNPDQQWFVMTYILCKDTVTDPIGYFWILEAYRTKADAERKAKELIAETGIDTIIVAQAGQLLPISRVSMGHVVPVNVDREGKLLQIARDDADTKVKESKDRDQLNSILEQRSVELDDVSSTASLAQRWYLYTRYKSEFKQHMLEVERCKKIYSDNYSEVMKYPDRRDEVLQYLEQLLTLSHEEPLLRAIKDEILHSS